jgi:hypothetical protein
LHVKLYQIEKFSKVIIDEAFSGTEYETILPLLNAK